MGRPGLATHRKFRRLARALGSPLLARGALELLWDSCYEAGDDYVGTADDIEHAIGWTGERGMLTRALVEAGEPEGDGFLERVPATGPSSRAGKSGIVTGVTDVTDVTYRVHDLWHHAPDYVSDRRAKENERRIERVCAHCGGTYHSTDVRREYCSSACRQGGWRDRNGRNGSSVTRYVTETDRNGTPAPAPAPAPSTEKNGSSALLAEPPAPPLVIFPCVGKGFDSWALTEAQRNDWAKAYPALDIVSECRKACTWLAANPTRRKTARGMPAFLVGWLNRSTNRGGTVGLTALNGSRPGSAPQPIVGDWRADCSHDPPCSHPAMCEHRRRKGAMA
jgi:hypothetical protein